MRGPVTVWKSNIGLQRFIPACAGTRPHARRAAVGTPVHPRVCGDQSNLAHTVSRSDGSSPRVRGPGQLYTGPLVVRRFIPACAGTSSLSRHLGMSGTVHPRVCGDQWIKRKSYSLRIRFIPACAGTSSQSRTTDLAKTVHPRVCGDQCRTQLTDWTDAGSSPRVRGPDGQRLMFP